jgi:hypothetical protein
MRYVLTLLIVLGWSATAEATSPIQTCTNTAISGTTNTCTFSPAPTLGNTIVCSFHSNGTPTLSSVSGVATSWTARLSSTSTNQRLYFRDGPADGSTAIVTMTMTSNAGTPSLACAELDGAYVFDAQSTAATGSTSPATTNAVTTTAVNSFVFAATTKSSGSTTGSPDGFTAVSYTTGEADGRYAAAYLNVTTGPGSYSTSWNTSATVWATGVVAYTAPGGAPPASSGNQRLSSMGVGDSAR